MPPPNSAFRLAAIALLAAGLITLPRTSQGEQALLEIQADQLRNPLSRYLTGACIEDVNHEIYGGLYSQMIFGESFQEPAATAELQDFKTFGGRWLPLGDEVQAEGEDGAKIVSQIPGFETGEVGVDIWFSEA